MTKLSSGWGVKKDRAVKNEKLAEEKEKEIIADTKSKTRVSEHIKSKERVAEFGEVFTPEHIVNDMLDMVKDESYSIDKTFLEPSCGNGNFLVKILERKLDTAEKFVALGINRYNWNVLKALSTIYGIEIQEDNVIEARKRMKDIVSERYRKAAHGNLDEDTLKCVVYILDKNIMHGNFLLECKGDGRDLRSDERDELELMEWNFDDSNETVTKKYFTLASLKEGTMFSGTYNASFEPEVFNRLYVENLDAESRAEEAKATGASLGFEDLI